MPFADVEPSAAGENSDDAGEHTELTLLVLPLAPPPPCSTPLSSLGRIIANIADANDDNTTASRCRLSPLPLQPPRPRWKMSMSNNDSCHYSPTSPPPNGESNETIEKGALKAMLPLLMEIFSRYFHTHQFTSAKKKEKRDFYDLNRIIPRSARFSPSIL